MTEIERFERLKELGYKYDPETGDVISGEGHKIKNKNNFGYIRCWVTENKKKYVVRAHRFIWWLTHNEIPNQIDHINRVRDDNRLQNLRNVNHQKNQHNRLGKGYTKKGSGFQAVIRVDRKLIYLGQHKTEGEAQQAYLDAKKIYHKI